MLAGFCAGLIFGGGGGGEDRSEIREREKLTPERVRERASSIVL